MKIAVMTGGGDCPGLNAIIQAIVTRATKYGHEVLGVMGGYEGLLNGDIKPLSLKDVEGILSIGGTIVGTSRTNPFKTKDGLQKVLDIVKKFGIDALIAIGGDDTLGAAYELTKRGVPIVGVPKTIDNDLFATDYSIGFQTAVDTAVEAIERLHTTAKSHQRVMVVEIMGRYAGWLTLMAGLAGGAHIILIPEQPFDINSVCEVLGHIQRGGSPNSFDRILGVRLGLFAVDLVEQKKFGYAACLKGTEIVPVKIEDMIGKMRTVVEDLFELTQVFSKT